MMITGIEATRPQCGKKAWRKSEIVRSAERAYTRFPGIEAHGRPAVRCYYAERPDLMLRSDRVFLRNRVKLFL